MIYASDLDRTLIFSQKFLDMHPSDSHLILADESKINSYIGLNELDLLKAINRSNKVRFIPVTSRSIEEYKRTIFYREIKPEWAITTCGGTILHYGNAYSSWDKYIEGKIGGIDLEGVRIKFNSLKCVDYDSKIIDSRYVFTKISNRELAKKEIQELQSENKNYTFILDKHKLYGVPNCLGKDKALMWLRSLLGEKEIVSSGDSDFDVPMLSISDICFIPTHHSIKNIQDKMKELKSVVMVDGGVESASATLSYIRSRI